MSHPNLDALIRGYLNQDYAHHGETVEDVIAAFKRDSPPTCNAQTREEISRFIADHPQDLEEAFVRMYWFDFEPAAWGMTVAQFLALLDETLAVP